VAPKKKRNESYVETYVLSLQYLSVFLFFRIGVVFVQYGRGSRILPAAAKVDNLRP